MDYKDYKLKLREQVLQRMDYSKDLKDEEVWGIIDEVVLEQDTYKLLPVSISRKLRGELFDSLRRLDVLQHFVEDSTITEIMINGPNHIFVEKAGVLRKQEQVFESEEKLRDVIQQIVAGCNRVVNEASPIVDARLEKEQKNNKILYKCHNKRYKGAFKIKVDETYDRCYN